MRRAHHLLAAGAVASACLTTFGATASAQATTGVPSPVVLRPAGPDLTLQPLSYCRAATATRPGLCVDAMPPTDAALPIVRTSRGLRFSFGLTGWRFTASVVRIRTSHEVRGTTVRRVAPHRFRISRPAHPGLFRVLLYGKGAAGTESFIFRWRVR